MANYNLVVGSLFKPYSFDEYILPYKMVSDAYVNTEEAYSELENNANALEGFIDQTRDKETYERYLNYKQGLNDAVDNLYENGLTPDSRQLLMKLKRGYLKDIAPISLANERRATDIAAQRKGHEADNSIIYDRDASDTSLEDYIKNPALSYDSISGNSIKQRVADAVKGYADSLIETGEWRNTAGGLLIERIVSRGLTGEDIQEIASNPEAFPEILKILQDVVSTSGVSSWGNKGAEEALANYAFEGVFAGLGKPEVDVRENRDYISAYDLWKQELADKNRSGDSNHKGGPGKDAKEDYYDEYEYMIETAPLDSTNYNTFYQDAQGNTVTKEILDLEDKIKEKENNYYRAKALARKATIAGKEIDEENDANVKLAKLTWEDAKKEHLEAINALSKKMDEYSHLAKSREEAALFGQKLHNAMRMVSNKAYRMTKLSDTSAYKDALLDKVLAGAYSNPEHSGIFKDEKGGKEIKASNLPDKENLQLSYTRNGVRLVDTTDPDKSYIVKNSSEMTNASVEAQGISSFIEDYSKNMTLKGYLNIVDNKDFKGKTSVDQVFKNIDYYFKQYGKPITGGSRGLTIKAGYKNYVKVVQYRDKNGNDAYIITGSDDAISNGGKLYQRDFKRYLYDRIDQIREK